MVLHRYAYRFLLTASVFFLIFLFFSCTPSTRYGGDEDDNDSTTVVIEDTIKKPPVDDVRLKLPENDIAFLIETYDQPISFLCSDLITVSDAESEISDFEKGTVITFSVRGDKVRGKALESIFEGNELTLSAPAGSYIEFEGKKYRGDVLLKSNNEQLLVSNKTALQDFLAGYIGSITGKQDDERFLEALKAISVAVRTLIAYSISAGNVAYSLDSRLLPYAYNGIESEQDIITEAVLKTEGEYLSYNNNFAMTLFHDCCGGWIESIVNSYPIEKAKPYLITQQDGLPPFCGISDDFSWTVQFTSETILQNLRSMGKLDNNVNVLKDIKITETFPSGRVKTITVTAGTGNIITLPAGSIEDVFKKPDDEHNHINSTLFELLTTKQGDAVEKVVLIGKGSGSGAGMCIWGAMGRARDGWNYKDILSFYFPGTTLNK